MKKSCDGIPDCNISPVRRNLKHQMTPLSTRQKTSRRDQGIDVHTTCSTPNAHASKFINSFNSPSGSIPYSQENYPDVIWDYTSPKLPKGAKRREIKITVEEFLKNLAHCQEEECSTQSAHYTKLLESWMSKQNTTMNVKKANEGVRKVKKRSRRVLEEIKKFMESIQRQREATSPIANMRKECAAEDKIKELALGNVRVKPDRKSFLEGDDNDSSDELWGEADNSFIVKATQELEHSSSLFNSNNNKNNLDVLSTIPETICSTSNASKFAVPLEQAKGISDKSSDSKMIPDSNCFEHCTEFILSQLIDCDWDSETDDDWDNGFLAEDDTLNLVPDEVLLGKKSSVNVQMHVDGSVLSNNELNLVDVKDQNFSHDTESKDMKVDSSNESGCSIHKGSSVRVKNEENSGELFNNFDDESFGDESVLCKPEILSWIDEVESKLSQSQKCTAEEIEKKKDEALRRRQKKQLGI